MTEFQAALGLTQMRKLDRIIASRRRLAAFYDQLLEGRPLQVPVVSPGNKSAYQSYVVLLPERFAVRRDGLIASLKNKGVESSIGTCHMPITTYYRARYGHQIGVFPVTDHVFARSLTLPLYETLSEQEQRQVVNSLCEDLTP